MSKKTQPTAISALLPRAIKTLEHATKPQSASIDKAAAWISAGGFGVSDFDTKQEREDIIRAFQESARWLASWHDGLEPYWLVLIGWSGTGKTMLTKRMAAFCERFGPSTFDRTVRAAHGAYTQDSDAIYSYRQEGSIFLPWRDLVPHSSENQARFARAGKDWVKMIDDLRAVTGEPIIIDGEQGIKPKPFEAGAAGDLLDNRLRKWTVINSNLSRAKLALFWDVRIASRLTRDGNTIVDLSNVRDFCNRAPKTSN